MSSESTGAGAGETYDEGVLVAEFEKNARETVKVRLTSFKGIDLVDLRSFYEDKDGSHKPGKGLCLRIGLLPELRKAIAAAEKAVKDKGKEAA